MSAPILRILQEYIRLLYDTELSHWAVNAVEESSKEAFRKMIRTGSPEIDTVGNAEFSTTKLAVP